MVESNDPSPGSLPPVMRAIIVTSEVVGLAVFAGIAIASGMDWKVVAAVFAVAAPLSATVLFFALRSSGK